MPLEISVIEKTTTDDLMGGGGQAGIVIEAIRRRVEQWVLSGMKDPLTISIKKVENKAPPSLGINLDDGSKTGEAIGGGKP